MARVRDLSDDFSIHSRQKRTGKVFYVQFRLPNGAWATAKSTGIRDDGKKRSYSEAVAWAQQYLDTGQVVTAANMTLGRFAAGFFDWDGEWAKDKRLRGRRISEYWCDHQARAVKNHIVPYLGTMKLDDIDDEVVAQWQRRLHDKRLAGATINRTTVALRVMLKSAYRKKFMRRLPVIEAVSERDGKKRDSFTPKEAAKVFSLEWPDIRHRVANYLALGTGCRAGEIAALKESNIKDGYIEVRHTWTAGRGLGPTKTGRTRIVPLPPSVAASVSELIAANPHEGDDRFLFFTVQPDRPLDPAEFNRALRKVLPAVGIDEADRQRRNLTFHSWRHTFNSLLVNRGIPRSLVQAATGHLSDSMTDHYSHADASALAPVAATVTAWLEDASKETE